MQVYEVLNYFDRSRYFISARSEAEMLEAVDREFLRRLNEEIEKPDESGERQYDYLRHRRESRMENIEYTLLVEDATKLSVVEHNLPGDLHKFYF